MKTKVIAHETKIKAQRELKYQLCRTDITVVHCSYFYDEIDETHKALICYYE